MHDNNSAIQLRGCTLLFDISSPIPKLLDHRACDSVCTVESAIKQDERNVTAVKAKSARVSTEGLMVTEKVRGQGLQG